MIYNILLTKMFDQDNSGIPIIIDTSLDNDDDFDGWVDTRVDKTRVSNDKRNRTMSSDSTTDSDSDSTTDSYSDSSSETDSDSDSDSGYLPDSTGTQDDEDDKKKPMKDNQFPFSQHIKVQRESLYLPVLVGVLIILFVSDIPSVLLFVILLAALWQLRIFPFSS